MRLFGGPTPNTTTVTTAWLPRARLVTTSAKKFALLASISAHARKSSPSAGKTAQNQRFFACRANFFALTGATAASQHPPTDSPETDDTNAGGSLTRNETADTFARTKQPISGRFPPAKASPVSSNVESGLLIHSKALRRSCLLPPSQSW